MQSEKWIVLSERLVLDHPYVRVRMQEIQISDYQVVPDWPIIETREYANVLVLDETRQAMIIEGYKHGIGRSNWQVVGGYLEPGEEPLAAMKRELMEETGFASAEWLYLGSHVIDANRYVGRGHFFLAKDARRVAEPDHDDLESFEIRWVTLGELQKALFDGRVAIVSYAITIALGLLALKQGTDQASSSA